MLSLAQLWSALISFEFLFRLSTVRNADLIVAMKDGSVQEMGTHNELMKRRGFYYDLVESQLVEKGEAEEPANYTIEQSSETKLKSRNIISAQLSRQQSSTALEIFPDQNQGQKVESNISSRQKLFFRLAILSIPELAYIVVGCIASVIFSIGTPLVAILFGDMLECFSLPPNNAIIQAQTYALMFAGVGLGFLLSTGIQGWMFSISGQRLTERVRILMFKHLLNQEIGWFDLKKNNSGAICTRLSTNAVAISGATGTKVGQMITGITTLFLSAGLALYYNLKLGLVSSVFLPFLCLGIMFHLKMTLNETKMLKNTLENSTKIATESINNIRTVTSLGCEARVLHEYEKTLEEAFVKSKWNTHFRGFILGFANSNAFLAYGVCFLYGTTLIRNSCPDELAITDVFKVALAVLQGGGMIGASFQGLMDMNKAFESAEQIFGIIDRTPEVDVNPQKTVTTSNAVKGDVDLDRAEFCYPSRKEIKVLNKMDLSIKQGEKIALVGPSGRLINII